MKRTSWLFALALCAGTTILYSQKSQNTVAIQPFFETELKQPVQFSMDLPFKVKMHEHTLPGEAATASKVYVIKPDRGPQNVEMQLFLSDTAAGFNIPKGARVAGVPVDISASTVRALIWYRNGEKQEGMQILFLKEIKLKGVTHDLGFSITGKQAFLEKHYIGLLRAFEASTVIPVSDL